MIVADASVLAPALVDEGDSGATARSRLVGQTLAAPELVDLEVLSALRRLLRARKLSAQRAHLALADLADMPMQRVAHKPLLPRCWELRNNLTVYDAAYVALAELLDAVLITADRRLARAPGRRCAVDVLG